MIQLRQYQEDGINKLAFKTAQGKRKLIFQLATGGGKTVTFAGLIARFLQKQQKKALILVHREELLKQARSTLFKMYNIVAAPITAGTTYIPQNSMVYVAMVETANNRLRKNPNYFGNIGVVIVDEAHLGNFTKLYEYFPNSIIIGFTATPISSNKRSPLKDTFDDIVCGVDIPDLIASGSLVKNVTYDIKNVNRKDFKVKNGEFDEAEMARIMSGSKHVQNAVAAYKRYADKTKAIIFNANVEHSKKVNAAFVAMGFPARHLDGETPPHIREETFRWFKETHGAILNNVGIATTGFDEPSVQTVMVNKLTKSQPLWLQMTGRGSRPFPGKDHFLILDMGGNAAGEHGDWCISRDWNDIFHNPEKAYGGGEAPSKACVGCRGIIHLSTKICPLCGANNQRAVKYDEGPVTMGRHGDLKPFTIDIPNLVNEHAEKGYKEYYTLQFIKTRIIQHASRVWRLKKLDERTSSALIGAYQEQVQKWCKEKEKPYNRWHMEMTGQWLKDEMKRVFEWEPEKQIA